MLDNLVYGKNAVEALLKSDKEVDTVIISTTLDKGAAGYFNALAREKGAVVKTVPQKKLDAMSSGAVHQGLAAFTAEVEYLTLGDAVEFANNPNSVFLILENICDPHNIGALLRTAYLFGVTCVFMPKRRGAGVTSVAVKTSAGAALKIPVARVANIGEAIRRLKDNGVFVYATDMAGEPCENADFSGKVALVMGAEDTGVSQSVKKLCDGLYSISQRHDDSIDSLNVSVAGGIILNMMKRV